MRGDDHRRGADQHDRRKILQRVERQVGQQARIGAVGVEHQHERGAVRRRRDRGLRADRAGRAAAVLDQDRRFQVPLEQRLNAPRDQIGGAARRKRDDDADGFRRPGLCAPAGRASQSATQSDGQDRKHAPQFVHRRLPKAFACQRFVDENFGAHSAARRRSISIAPALIRGMSSRPNSTVSLNGSKPRIRNESTPSV